MRRQRVYWYAAFKNSDQLYMLDGAVVRYSPEKRGICYEHHLIRDNSCIFEKPQIQFYGLPIGETVEFRLEAEDDGLFSFLEIRFTKRGALVASFADRDSKVTIAQVPADFDDVKVRVRVRGTGSTQLLSVTARVTSLEGLIFAGDRSLSETMAVEEIAGSADSLLVSFSHEPRYLTAEFFTASKPQLHFATINGKFDTEVVSQFLSEKKIRRLNLYQAPPELLQKLEEFATIIIIE